MFNWYNIKCLFVKQEVWAKHYSNAWGQYNPRLGAGGIAVVIWVPRPWVWHVLEAAIVLGTVLGLGILLAHTPIYDFIHSHLHYGQSN